LIFNIQILKILYIINKIKRKFITATVGRRVKKVYLIDVTRIFKKIISKYPKIPAFD
jgi:hypothetical protein